MPAPRHKPTKELRQVVHRLASLGLKREVICHAVGVTLPTLIKYYRDELDSGDAFGLGKIGQALMDKIESGDTAAIIFASKTRLGFKEISRVEQTGADGEAIKIENDGPRERIERRLAGLRVVGGTDTDS